MMLNWITPFFRTDLFIPHGHCYLWKPELVGLHILSDLLIAVAYYSIPLTLFYFVRRRQDLPFTWVFLLFSTFIVACGTTHLMEIWTLWHPTYWLSGAIKLMTAAISLATAVLLIPIIPKALALPNPAQLEAVNQALQCEITERQQMNLALQASEARLAGILAIAEDAIISINANQCITLFNQGAERIFGYTAAEVIGQPLDLLLPNQLADVHRQHVADFSQTPQISRNMGNRREVLGCRRDGTEFAAEASISQLQLGNEVIFTAFLRDITERKQVEQALRESENRFQTFMDNSPAAAWMTDAAGRILYLSQAYSHLVQVPNDAIGKTIFEVFAPEIAEQLHHNIQQVIETNQTVEAIEVAPRPNGTLGEFLVYKFLICELSGQCVVGGVAVDVTERQQVKKQLRSLNERLQHLLTHAPVVIFSCKADGDYGATWVSDNVRTLLGYEPREFIEESDFWVNHIHPEDREQIFANVSQIFVTGHHTHEFRFLHGDGDYCWVYEQLQLIRDEAGNPTEIIGYLADISDRKQIALELELQSTVVRNMAEGVCLVKAADGTIVYTNPKFERIFGYNAGELKGKHVSIVNYEDEVTNPHAVYQEISTAILQHGEATYEVHNVKKDGTPFWCQATTSLFEHPDYGTLLVAVQQDISARKQAETMIQASLKEKEVLLKEIHHRVKNNLGVVDGLLQMQARRSTNPQVVETLKESQNRITSIALIHEKLYGSEDLANIDFAQYISALTAHLFDSYNIHSSQIKLTTQIDHIPLDIDTAIPCGLIINELVSNSLKYAFSDIQTGEIQVTLHQQQDRALVLRVRDNGIGLPQNFNLNQTKTLGMNLVKGLVKQLKGTLEVDTQQGTTFLISVNRT